MLPFWDALTRQRTDGALVRLITPVYEFEELEDAEERLQGFVGDIVPVLGNTSRVRRWGNWDTGRQSRRTDFKAGIRRGALAAAHGFQGCKSPAESMLPAGILCNPNSTG